MTPAALCGRRLGRLRLYEGTGARIGWLRAWGREALAEARALEPGELARRMALESARAYHVSAARLVLGDRVRDGQLVARVRP